MDLFLIFYSILAVINISIFLVNISIIIQNKKIFILIGIILIALISILGMLKPIKMEVDTINDCIAYYSYIKVLPKEHSFSFLERCDFNEEQIQKMINYSNIPTFKYPVFSNNWSDIKWE